MNACGAIYAAQVIGGPEWLNKDAYLINGKASDELASALQKMTREERMDRTRMLQQSLSPATSPIVPSWTTPRPTRKLTSAAMR